MQITKFEINSERDAISLQLINAELLNSLLLFTNKTYKDYSLAVNLNHLIQEGANVQNIEIPINELNTPFFDGLFVIEAESEDDIISALEYDLTRYEECILEKLVKFALCDDCLKNKSLSLINSQALLEGVKSAVKEGFIEEAFNLIKALDIFCSNKCKTCGNYKNVIKNDYYDYNKE
jgi:hypothetical protein